MEFTIDDRMVTKHLPVKVLTEYRGPRIFPPATAAAAAASSTPVVEPVPAKSVHVATAEPESEMEEAGDASDDEEDTAQEREEEDAYLEGEDLPEEGSHSSQPPSIEWSDEIIVTDIGQEETNRGAHLRHDRDRSGLSYDSPSSHTEAGCFRLFCPEVEDIAKLINDGMNRVLFSSVSALLGESVVR